MTKQLKEYNVVLQYEVQKIYTVSAKNQEEYFFNIWFHKNFI